MMDWTEICSCRSCGSVCTLDGFSPYLFLFDCVVEGGRFNMLFADFCVFVS